jgi:hypothetical protein
MYVPPCMNKLEEGANELPKARRIVPHHGQAAAAFWPIERESGNDGITSDPFGSLKARDICGAITLLGEEVERRPIMPDVVCALGLPGCGVCDDPISLRSEDPKARLGRFQCGLG